MALRTITQEWLEGLSVAELEAEVRKHNRLYWDEHKPEISDYDYDRIVQRLKALAPSSTVLEEMGETVRAGRDEDGAPPVRHRVPMLSLDKCYSHEELMKWAATFSGKVMVSPKFDGIACALHYDADGVLTLAATRGDGTVGENITANARVIKDIPTKISLRSVEVRGEIFMKRSVFEKFKAEGFANPRNLTAGAIKQKDVKKSEAYGLSFAAYDLLGTDHETEHNKMDALAAMGFAPIEKSVVDKDAMIAAYEAMAARRSQLDFEIDGVVFKVDSVQEQRRLGTTSHHPRYAIAYKFQGDSGSTIVREIEWSVARSGAITPVALIDPVTLSGATVSRASLHNAGYIDKLALTKNATVVVMRRGGVIPNVEFVSKAGDGKFELPTTCPSCGGPVRREGDILFCVRPRACRSAVIAQLAHYASVVGMLGFGDAILASAFDRGILVRPADFYTLTEQKLLSLDRVGSRLAKRLLREVDRARKLDLATFLRAFGMNEVGKLVSELLAEKYGSLEKIYAATEEELATIPRIGPIIARAIVRSLDEAKDEIEATRKYVEIVTVNDHSAANATEATPTGATAPLAGLSFVFTGTLATIRRAEAERMVKDRGGLVQDHVTKNLHYLVVGAQRTDARSSKEKMAEKLIESGAPIQVIGEKDFIAMINAADERAKSGAIAARDEHINDGVFSVPSAQTARAHSEPVTPEVKPLTLTSPTAHRSTPTRSMATGHPTKPEPSESEPSEPPAIQAPREFDHASSATNGQRDMGRE